MSQLSNIIKVPEGMSCINAFRALWERSKPAAFFQANGISDAPQAATVSTAEKVAAFFTHQTYFDYQGGRMLKTNFAQFPQLDVSLYDHDFGSGAAQKAIETYNLIPSDQRFDNGDCYKFEDLLKGVIRGCELVHEDLVSGSNDQDSMSVLRITLLAVGIIGVAYGTYKVAAFLKARWSNNASPAEHVD